MGTLFVVGIGPGTPLLLTPQAGRALAESSDLVGYRLYLELLGSRTRDKECHDLALGAEVERARLALDLAAGGRTTALISSGDTGIYAMASLVFELLERQCFSQGETMDDNWQNIDIQVLPGISAMQAAAAATGAALGHDFCAISLSDLLTPWETIKMRIEAAAGGDFVVTFYNPVSRKRRWQLAEAKTILLQQRPATTPVVLGRNLTRANERVTVTTLGELTVADVDMLTVVLVGNTTTRAFDSGRRRWIYTPRGYGRKHEREATP